MTFNLAAATGRHAKPKALAAISVAVGLLGAGSFAAVPAAAAATTQTVTIGVYAGNLLSAEVAEAEGYFAKEGINVELKTLQAGPAIVAATESGSVDIGVGDTLAWAAAVGHGFTDLDLFAASTMQTPALGSDEHLIAGKGITSPSQLSGKTIGYIPYPEITVATKLWLQQHGVNPSTVKFITISDGTQISLLEKGGANVVEGRNEGENEEIVKSAGGTDLGEVFGVLPDDTINVSYFAKKSWLAKDPALDQKVALALSEGAAYTKTAPATKLASIATTYAGFNYTALSKQYPGIIQKTDWYREAPPFFSPTSVKATNAWIADGVKEGQVTKAFDISPYLWSTAKSANGS